MDQSTKELVYEGVKTLLLPLLAWFVKGLWDKRTRPYVEGLKVHEQDGWCSISPDDQVSSGPTTPERAQAIVLTFVNNTRQKLYIHHAYITDFSGQVHGLASKDIGTKSFELKFRSPDGRRYSEREVILDTGATATTLLPLSRDGSSQPPWHVKLANWMLMKPANYRLCYSVTIGDKCVRVRSSR